MKEDIRANIERVPQTISQVTSDISKSVTHWHRRREGRKAIQRIEAKQARREEAQFRTEEAREFALTRAHANAANVLPTGKQIALNELSARYNYISELRRRANTLREASGFFGVLGASLLTLGAASEGYLQFMGIKPEAATEVAKSVGTGLVMMGLEAANTLETLSGLARISSADLIQAASPVLHGAGQLLEGTAFQGAHALQFAEQAGPAMLVSGGLAVGWGLMERLQLRENRNNINRESAQAADIMAGIAH